MDEGLIAGDDGRMRCFWHGNLPDYLRYHDEEWGRPVTSDFRLFEKLCLEGFQSGLSWLTILRKRENFRAAFDGFDYHKVATYTGADVERLLGNAGIIRHRGKIEASINNAGRAIEMEREFGSLAAYFWGHEPRPDERPSVLTLEALRTNTTTPVSVRISKDLKKRGWKFVGPTTVYAFMQAMGLVNDHIEGCCCRDEVERLRAELVRPVAKA
ncbi:DNA-3-methyladenine glycosylase I [Martelella endophytica]|uniref:3-methyladenine DNA glycosylase n=1 Tax=Martelella endophytica TaxID=1486262 RepID=A0A0D5LQW3_MAREN|nr:DNA-3-methyladenine glycosylase I [Martelella endophytica]AJY46152.1 3-methyladenine DNA glycosylase [Martelella endophytica]